MPVRIAPSILAADFGRLGEEIAGRRRRRGRLDSHRCDGWGVCPEHFVWHARRRTAARSATKLPLDVHLMIQPVEPHLEEFVAAGADADHNPRRSCRGPCRMLCAGFAVSACAPGFRCGRGRRSHPLWPYLGALDVLLVMSVEPGAGGQAFIPEMLDRIASLADRITCAIAPGIDLGGRRRHQRG